MSPDLEDLLRGELRGAASGAPHHLGVADTDVISRGRRVVVRRRILTGVCAAAVVLALAPARSATSRLTPGSTEAAVDQLRRLTLRAHVVSRARPGT